MRYVNMENQARPSRFVMIKRRKMFQKNDNSEREEGFPNDLEYKIPYIYIYIGGVTPFIQFV